MAATEQTPAPTGSVAASPASAHLGGLPPELWEGRHAWLLRIVYLHVPVLFAVAFAFGEEPWHSLQEVALVLALALGATNLPSRRARGLLAAAALLTCSAILVHFTGGLIESHFHFFVVVTLLAFYEDRWVYALAVGYVFVHHGVMGALFADVSPVFDHPGRPEVPAGVWATVHAGFILLAGLTNVLLARMNARTRELATSEVARRTRAEATAEALSEAFTPNRLPYLGERAQVAAAYAPGDGHIGGDFYEVVELVDGRVGIGVGDVAGHGPRAAGLTAKLRHTLRAYAADGLEPAAVMDKLERARAGDGSATCAYLLVDTSCETVTGSLAGHLPPVVVGPDGHVEMLGGGLSVPLAGLGVPHVQETRPLPAGSTLLVYTDGLVERRGEPIDAGLRRLREAVAAIGSGPADLCARLPAMLLEGAAQTDDIAVVALRTEAMESPRGLPPAERLDRGRRVRPRT